MLISVEKKSKSFSDDCNESDRQRIASCRSGESNDFNLKDYNFDISKLVVWAYNKKLL